MCLVKLIIYITIPQTGQHSPSGVTVPSVQFGAAQRTAYTLIHA